MKRILLAFLCLTMLSSLVMAQGMSDQQVLQFIASETRAGTKQSQIFTKIPEDFKVDGNQFIVRDATDTEYLVEWCIDKKNNISEGRIINERNLKEADKTINRMAELMGYNSSSIYGRS